MLEVNWRRGSGPPLLALLMLLALAAAPASAAAIPTAVTVAGVDACGLAVVDAAPPGRAWYRRSSKPDARGWLRGYTLDAGSAGGRTTLRVSLSNESFVAPPARGLLLYGTDDGKRSEVRVVRLADGCDARVLVSGDVVRSGSIDPTGTTLYLHTVDRTTRADLGISRRSLRGGGAPVRVLPGLVESDGGWFGPTFVTILSWSLSDQTLAVQTCGQVMCRTRLYDPATGTVSLDESVGRGELIALTDREQIMYAGCHGLPCAILAIGADGSTRTVVESAVTAAVVGRGASRQLWYETPDAQGTIHLRRQSLATRHDDEVAGAGSLRLLWPSRWADAAVEAPAGSALLSQDGTWSHMHDIQTATVDGSHTLRLQPLEEVSR
jgi:hypothetical protein